MKITRQDTKPSVLQIVGYKNSGKTTLICNLVEHLSKAGHRIAVIKHDGHGFEMDRPNTDTFRFGEAGAVATAITSLKRTAILEEREASLSELVSHFSGYDVILIEGFKSENYPKIVIVHEYEDTKLIGELSNVQLVVFWEKAEAEVGIAIGTRAIPSLSIHDSAKTALWVDKWLNLNL